MMKPARMAIHLMALGVFMMSLSACQKQEAAEAGKSTAGPAEKAGQQLDQAAVRAGEEFNKAAEKAGTGLQELGQKIQNAAQDAQDSQKKE